MAAGLVVTATTGYLDGFSGRWKKSTAAIQMTEEKTVQPPVMEKLVRGAF